MLTLCVFLEDLVYTQRAIYSYNRYVLYEYISCMYVYVYMYVYMHVHMHMHMHMYMYMYMHTSSVRRGTCLQAMSQVASWTTFEVHVSLTTHGAIPGCKASCHMLSTNPEAKQPLAWKPRAHRPRSPTAEATKGRTRPSPLPQSPKSSPVRGKKSENYRTFTHRIPIGGPQQSHPQSQGLLRAFNSY